MHVEITRRVEDGLGISLPTEITSGLNVSEGDRVFLFEDSEGGFRLLPRNGHATTMEIMKSIAKRYSNALSELAKGE
jgi:hypothetical protein